jgi:hypothetical protein
MKSSKYFLMALLASAVAFTSCKDDPKPKEPEKPSVETPEVAAVPGKIVIVLNVVDAEVCGGIVFAGNYNDYSLTVADMAAFAPIADYPGWYKAEITPADPEADTILIGKPCHLGADDTFPNDWGYQWYPTVEADGTTVAKQVEIIKGSATLANDYGLEKKILVAKGADVVYIRTYAWKKNPCEPAETFNVTFNVTIPEIGATDVVYVAGGFNSWTATATPMTKVDATHWTVQVPDVELGAGYKYVVNGSWDYEELAAIAEGADCAQGIDDRHINDRAMTDVVSNFKGVTATKCED